MIRERLVCFVVVFFIGIQLHGQGTPVRVINHFNGKPVAFAHIKVAGHGSDSTRYSITDTTGYSTLFINQPTEVIVSSVGYKNSKDTLYPGRETTIILQLEILELEELVVTAQYTPVSVDKSLYRVKILNNMQIKKRAAYDLAGLLRTQMNVRLSHDGSLGTGMSMQGLSGENVKILVDGVPVIGRLNGIIDLGQINLAQAQQVEVIEGPMSVIYGSNALAGVINIILQNPIKGGFHAYVSSYLESVGVYNFDGKVGFTSGKHNYSLSAGRNFFSGYSSSANNGRVMDWKPKRQVNIDSDYGLDLKKMSIKTRISLFDEMLRSNGALMPPYFEKAFDNYFRTQRYSGKLTLATKGANNFVIDNSYSWYKRTRELYYNNLSLLEKTHIENDETYFNSFLSRGIYTLVYKPVKLSMQTGYDINFESAKGRRVGYGTEKMIDLGLFLTVQYMPTSYLSIQPGLRVAFNSDYETPLIYAFHVKAGPFKKFTIRTSWSSGFRAPSLKELYLNFVDVNHNIIGNSNLEAEKSQNLQLQLGRKIQFNKSAGEVELNLFANNIHDIITLAERDDGSYTFVNVDMFKTRGYNLNYRSFWKSGIELRLGYGNTGKLNHAADSGNNYLWSPEVTSEISYTHQKSQLFATLFYKYSGEVPRYLINEIGEVSQGAIHDYHTLDVSIGKSYFGDRLSVTVGGKNLFNVKDITSSGNVTGGIHEGSSSSVPVAWGRTFFVKLNYSVSSGKKN